MRVLITGGTGFLGRHCAVRLQRQGHVVSILGRNDRIGAELQKRGIRYLKADLIDAPKVIEACRDQDQVIHSGGLASPWGKYAAFYQANVEGTRNILQGCKTFGVHRLVHLSTPSLYFDYHHRLGIKETDPLPKPATAYAATKLLADELVEKAFAEGLPSIRLRPRAIFGPGDQAVLVRVLEAAKKGVVPLVGGGTSQVDLTYIDNVVDSVVLAMVAPATALGKVYNITNGEPQTMREMIARLSSALGQEIKVRPMPFGVAYGLATAMELFSKVFRPSHEPPLTRYAVGLMARSQTLDISAARRDLGYTPQVKLDEGIRRFARWWQKKDGATYAEQLGL
jgi:nucleoside-diphosphate-sugar epimerase